MNKIQENRTYIKGNIQYLFILVLFVIVQSCNNSNNNNSFSITGHECSQLLNDYLSHLATGDSSSIKQFWSNKSFASRGFWTMHNHFYPWGDYANWKTKIPGSTFEILSVNFEKEYCILETKWIPKDTLRYKNRKLKYHIINENNRLVFINPIDLYTSNWKSYSTEHIVFHFPPEIDVNQYLEEIHYAEKEFSKALKIFNLQLNKKIDFYRARNDIECGKLMNFGPVNGYVFMPQQNEESFGKEIWFTASSSFINHHEFIHVITGLLGIPFNNSAITEGLACAFAGGFHTTPDFTINDAQNQIIQSFNYPLKELLLMDEHTFTANNYITYTQSGSFIKYLYDQYGIDKLKDLCAKPLSSNQVLPSIESNYQKSIDQIENEWIAYILGKKTPEIGFRIPSDAEQVFYLPDDVGDDVGDGDYTYPKYGEYPPGCFDLKKLEVLKDKTHAYFRIEFVKLKNPLVFGNDKRAEKFVPGCVIAIRKGEGVNRYLQKHCHGVRFSGDDGYNLKLNVGTNVSLTNNFGETFFSSPEIVDQISNYEKNIVEFSVPLELIGTPNEDWKYFAGTCLISNRVMNFLGEPLTVYKNPPFQVFIEGGNYDFGNPAYMDILLPAGKNQTEILSAYNADINKLAVVPMIGP